MHISNHDLSPTKIHVWLNYSSELHSKIRRYILSLVYIYIYNSLANSEYCFNHNYNLKKIQLGQKKKNHPAVLSPAFTQVQLNMEGERRRQEKQAVLIRTWVLSGTRAASACQMKSISQWEAVGTVPHGPFHHLSHFIHATTARLMPHWLHLEPCICQFGCRVMKTIPMYKCRTYCKQSIEEICAGGGGVKIHESAA